MIEPNTEDRLEAERIKIEYMKVQERLAIQALVSTTRAVLMAEGAIYKHGWTFRRLKCRILPLFKYLLP